ncbi:MAG: 3-hydroxyacyl-CoA dehydrogenase [Spirochaetes bacterium]|nr:3-hydroxyacyl-CoA dehydrogenase [Spirochaetota bacterium]
MKAGEIKKVLIIGSGTMGRQIGFLCASCGYDVVMYDIETKALEGAKKGVEKVSKSFLQWKKCTPESAEESLSRITYTSDPLAAARDADLVSESVPENPELKERVFAQFHELCPERTIFTSNTSSLVASQFAKGCGRPEKLVAFHFYDVRTAVIADVMPHPGTTRDTVNVVMDFARSLKQIPILLEKEYPGFLFNNILMAIMGSALTLASRKIAPIQDIDRSWTGVLRIPMGPFAMMDGVGLDTVWHITNYWADKLKDPQSQANARFLKDFVDKGKLGVKSGEGFYTYPNPEFQRPGFLEGTK